MELGGDVGLLFGDVSRFTEIILQIKEQTFLGVPEVHQLVVTFADGGLRMFDLDSLMPDEAINGAIHQCFASTEQ